jgi:hypothetical protein
MGLWLLATLVSLGPMPIAGAQRSPASFPTSIDVSGIVVNAVTGKPIAGALVSTVRPDDWHRRSQSPPRNMLPPRPQTAQLRVKRRVRKNSRSPMPMAAFDLPQ